MLPEVASLGEHTSEEVRAKAREAAKRSNYFMAKAVIGFRDLTPACHGPFCEFMERPSIRKYGLAPRDHLKTSIWTITDCVRLIACNPNIRILLGNETATNASHMLRRIEQVFKNCTTFQWLFPELIPPDFSKTKWSETEMLVPRSEDYPESTIETIGVGGAVVSRHYNHIKLDDLVGKEASESDEVMRKTIDWYQYCESLLNHPNDRIDVYGTRWSYRDLYYWIDEHEPDVDKFHRSAITPEGMALWPERFPLEVLERLRQKIGPYKFSCNPGEAPVLMSDFSEKPIRFIRPGDEVVGYTFGKTGQRRLVKALVKVVGSRLAEVFKVHLESGRTIRCTLDHQWYTGRNDAAHPPYLPTAIGRDLLLVANTSTPHNLPSWGYLAAMVDGEGHCNHSCIQITQSRRSNPEVCHRIEEVLEHLVIPYETWIDNRGGRDCVIYTLKGGRQFKIDLLRLGQPSKKNDILKAIWKRPAKPILARDRVVNIEPDGVETVYSFETTSGNYVVWGYASKNCQYLNAPYDPEGGSFKPEWLNYFRLEGGVAIPEIGTSASIASMRRFMRVDPAFSQSDRAARTAIIVDGVCPLGRKFLLHTWAKRCDPSEMFDEIFRAYAAYGCESVHVESVAAQKLIKPWLAQECARRGQYINVQEVKPDSRKSKESRIRGIQPYLRAGEVYIMRSMEDFKGEYLAFPLGQTVDLLDAFAYGPYVWGMPDDEEVVDWDDEWHEDVDDRSAITGY